MGASGLLRGRTGLSGAPLRSGRACGASAPHPSNPLRVCRRTPWRFRAAFIKYLSKQCMGMVRILTTKEHKGAQRGRREPQRAQRTRKKEEALLSSFVRLPRLCG
jgi:hypothetical protein